MPIWVIAVNAAPGSSQPNASPTTPQVGAGGDRQELGQPLHDAQDDGLDPAHQRVPAGTVRTGRDDGSGRHDALTLGGAARRPAAPLRASGCSPVPGRVAPVGWPVVEQRALGRSGLVVSRLALGTMTWGRDTDEDEAAMQLTAFVDAGGTLVDTADVYCDGESERILGPPARRRRPPLRRAGRHQGRRPDRRPGRWAAAPPAGTCWPRSTPPSSGWAWTTSTSGSCTPGTRRRRSRRPSPPATSRSPPGGPATSASATSPAGRPRRPPPGSAPGPAARRSSAPRSSTRCCSAASSARSSRPPRRWGSACCRGRRWAAGCSPASTGTARRRSPAAPRRSGRASSTGCARRRPTGSSRP